MRASSAQAAQAAALDTGQAKSRADRVGGGPLAEVNARDYGVEPPAPLGHQPTAQIEQQLGHRPGAASAAGG